MLERSGLPEAVLLGFRTMARIAGAEGAEHRALELLGALDAVGVARRLPRLRIASLADQVRLHARRFRAEDLPRPVRADRCPAGRARGAAGPAVAAQRRSCCARWRWATRPSPRRTGAAPPRRWRAPTPGPRTSSRAGCTSSCWACAPGCSTAAARSRCRLLREAVDLAATYGLLRVFDDAHPALGDWVREALPGAPSPPPGGPGRSRRAARARRRRRAAARARATPSMALTPKEREVLELLARNLSNKEIGLAMQVGEETIKWHMKNLFAKLDAGTRKQVVQRARILGLLETEA